MKEMFKDFIVHSDMTEIACIEIIRILEKSAQVHGYFKKLLVWCLERARNDSQCNGQLFVEHECTSNSTWSPNHQDFLCHLRKKGYAHLVRHLFENSLSKHFRPIAYGLIKSLDMRFRIPIDPMKVKFVREHLHEINYKGMRDLLKLALIDKLGSLKGAITEFQRLQLVQVEDVSSFWENH